MIQVSPGAVFEFTFVTDPGLAGVAGVRIRDNQGADALARTTVGITEDIAGSGHYQITLVAPLVSGQYSIIADDGAGHLSDPEELLVMAQIGNYVIGGAFPYQPSVDLVATNIMSRTRTRYGAMAGTFTASTTPTDTQVNAIIASVIPEIADSIGDTIPTYLLDDAAAVVAKRAAMQIELDFFPEQVATARSPYNLLKDQYEEALAKLQKQVALGEEGELRVVDPGPSTSPSYSFPAASNWLTRRM